MRSAARHLGQQKKRCNPQDRAELGGAKCNVATADRETYSQLPTQEWGDTRGGENKDLRKEPFARHDHLPRLRGKRQSRAGTTLHQSYDGGCFGRADVKHGTSSGSKQKHSQKLGWQNGRLPGKICQRKLKSWEDSAILETCRCGDDTQAWHDNSHPESEGDIFDILRGENGRTRGA